MNREPTEMEDRVARAIAFIDGVPSDYLTTTRDAYLNIAPYLKMARSAIRAMREPTEGMIEAGYDEDGGRYITWIRMIHAASPGDE